tara:strand:+ start:13831 stop:14532 length:702 start_codon:yes stop_codon:yes gene_type:complete
MTENIDNKPKKRGRKKKFETTPFKSNFIEEIPVVTPVIETQKINNDDYKTNNLRFGNIFIEVHDKETSKTNITNFFVDNTNESCMLTVSDEEDVCNFKSDKSKKITLYNTDNKACIKHDLKCYNCHHFFTDKPFYMPIDYCNKTNRYKLFGNFCSPNCVKSYCINDKIFQHKCYLVGQFYRKLFGHDFNITPAPSILNLKDYGGTLTIEQFRKSFYNNSRYTLLNLNSKLVYF